jgi:signal transduction protein with GAF and PtsI domain
VASDPFEAWRQIAAAQEKQLSALFERAAGTDAFAEGLGKALEAYLNATQVSRENVERFLAASNLPTRAEVARLAERVDQLTTRIDDLIAKISRKKKKKK